MAAPPPGSLIDSYASGALSIHMVLGPTIQIQINLYGPGVNHPTHLLMYMVPDPMLGETDCTLSTSVFVLIVVLEPTNHYQKLTKTEFLIRICLKMFKCFHLVFLAFWGPPRDVGAATWTTQRPRAPEFNFSHRSRPARRQNFANFARRSVRP